MCSCCYHDHSNCFVDVHGPWLNQGAQILSSGGRMMALQVAIRQAAAAAKQAALLGADPPAAAAFPMRPPDAPVPAPAAPSSAASQAAVGDAALPTQPPAGTIKSAEGAHAAALGAPADAGGLDPGLEGDMAGSSAALAPTNGADGSEPLAKRRKSNFGGG